MRRASIFFFAISISFLLSACGSGNENDLPHSMKNQNTDIAISLGMKKEEVEALLGEGTYLVFEDKSSEDFTQESKGATIIDGDGNRMEDYFYGENKDRLSIGYENDTVVAIVASEVVPEGYEKFSGANWCDQYGLSLANGTKEIVFQKYGECEVSFYAYGPDDRELHVFQYYFDANGRRVKELDKVSFSVCISLYADQDSLCFIAIYKEDEKTTSESN